MIHIENKSPGAKKERPDLEKSLLYDALITETIIEFFGLSAEEIKQFIDSVIFTNGIISPMFLSPGYGSNNDLKPIIITTLLSKRPDTYLHECRHGLHYQKCVSLFSNSATQAQAFKLFQENVLADADFLNSINKSGSNMQREFIEAITQRDIVSSEDIAHLASELGALTYQHAYFVDPRMIEAVASFQDTGITKFVGSINRIAALTIPHETFSLKGYGDKKSQNMFLKAEPKPADKNICISKHKVLMPYQMKTDILHYILLHKDLPPFNK